MASSGRKRQQSDYDGLPSSKRPLSAEPVEDAGEEGEDYYGGIDLAPFHKKQLVLKVQYLNKEKHELEDEISKLRKKISGLESSFSSINQHWDQLSQETNILLSRLCTTDTAYEVLENSAHCSDAAEAFMAALRGTSTDDDSEHVGITDAMLLERCKSTKLAVARLVEAIEREQIVNEKVYALVRDSVGTDETSNVLKENNEQLHRESQSLKEQLTSLQQKLHTSTQQAAQHRDVASKSEGQIETLQRQIEDKRLENERLFRRVQKLRERLAQAEEAAKAAGISVDANGSGGAAAAAGPTAASASTSADGTAKAETGAAVPADLEEKCRIVEKLASDRLAEIEEIRKERVKDRNELDKLRVAAATGSSANAATCSADASSGSFSTVDIAVHRALLQQYAIASREATECRTAYETAQRDLAQAVAQQRQDMEQMEGAEREKRQKLEQELQAAEERATAAKLERDRLKVQLERAGSSRDTENKTIQEMKTLIASLNKHVAHLNQSLARAKRKAGASAESATNSPAPQNGMAGAGDARTAADVAQYEKTIEELKANLKKAEEKEKEVNLLLNVYKTSARLSRETTDILFSEKKLQQEVEELREKVKELSEKQVSTSGSPMTDQELREALKAKEQEEEALMHEMEVIGNAYEEMQEQNHRLIQQLQQKDDSNLELMAQQIKASQLAQLLRDERDAIDAKMTALQAQGEATAQALKKIHEEKRVLREQVDNLKTEAYNRNLQLDAHRRKALEATQALQETKAELDRLKAQAEQLTKLMAEKNEQAETESHKRKRLEEEKAEMEDKLKRAQGMGTDTDALLLDEIRSFQEQMNCTLCKRRRKNATIAKCFHVFCYDCIKERWDLRARRCPGCQMQFSESDIKMLYF